MFFGFASGFWGQTQAWVADLTPKKQLGSVSERLCWQLQVERKGSARLLLILRFETVKDRYLDFQVHSE